MSSIADHESAGFAPRFDAVGRGIEEEGFGYRIGVGAQVRGEIGRDELRNLGDPVFNTSAPNLTESTLQDIIDDRIDDTEQWLR